MFLLVARVFIEIVLPIFIMVALGYIVARVRGVSPGPISTLTLNLFAPALGFSALTKATINGQDALQVIVFVVLFLAIMAALSVAVSRIAGLDRPTGTAFLLTTLFMNAGNFGLSLTLLAFGEQGMQLAVIYFVCQSSLGNSLGVFLASHSTAGVRQSLQATARSPIVYSAIAAVVVTIFQIPVPALIAKPAELLGNAAIPAMLVVLGAQLASGFKFGEDLKLVIGVTGVRLLLSAVVAFGLTWAMGIVGLNQQVLILLASMPTAVFTIIIATEFGANPKFVTSVVVVSTLASLFTVTLLLSVLLGVAPA